MSSRTEILFLIALTCAGLFITSRDPDVFSVSLLVFGSSVLLGKLLRKVATSYEREPLPEWVWEWGSRVYLASLAVAAAAGAVFAIDLCVDGFQGEVDWPRGRGAAALLPDRAKATLVGLGGLGAAAFSVWMTATLLGLRSWTSPRGRHAAARWSERPLGDRDAQ